MVEELLARAAGIQRVAKVEGMLARAASGSDAAARQRDAERCYAAARIVYATAVDRD